MVDVHGQQDPPVLASHGKDRANMRDADPEGLPKLFSMTSRSFASHTPFVAHHRAYHAGSGTQDATVDR